MCRKEASATWTPRTVASAPRPGFQLLAKPSHAGRRRAPRCTSRRCACRRTRSARRLQGAADVTGLHRWPHPAAYATKHFGPSSFLTPLRLSKCSGPLGSADEMLPQWSGLSSASASAARAAWLAREPCMSPDAPCTARLWLSWDFGAGPLVDGLLHSQVSVSMQSRLARSSP